MAKRHMKRCSTLLIIKTTMKCHLTLVGVVTVKKSINSKRSININSVEKREPFYCWRGCKLVQKSKFLQKTKDRVTLWSCSPAFGHISRENHNSKRYIHPCVHCSNIHNSRCNFLCDSGQPQTQLPRSMWNLPGPGIKPMSPALAGRFLTSGPPGKS